MTRTFKLVTSVVFGTWLLMSTGCEDKACKESLQTCKKEASDQRKECAGQLTTISELKTLLTETQNKVESLTKENQELKAAKSADTGSKSSKAKPAKAKHKKKKGKR